MGVTFAELLCGLYGITEPDKASEITERAYRDGIMDKSGISEGTVQICRRDAARLIHLYLKKQGVEDLADISGAEVLKDLYDCRVCVNHIAQVFLRGIMDGIRINAVSGDFLIFDGQRELSEDELVSIPEIAAGIIADKEKAKDF